LFFLGILFLINIVDNSVATAKSGRIIQVGNSGIVGDGEADAVTVGVAFGAAVGAEVGAAVGAGVGVGVGVVSNVAVIVPVPPNVAVVEAEAALLKVIDPVLDDHEENV
jgi:hypothetical protein